MEVLHSHQISSFISVSCLLHQLFVNQQGLVGWLVGWIGREGRNGSVVVVKVEGVSAVIAGCVFIITNGCCELVLLK